MKKLKIIAATDVNGIIGIDGKIPWSFKSEMDFFREYTINKTVIMGFNTFQSLNFPLKNRINIVVASDINKIKKRIESYKKENIPELPVILHTKSLTQFFGSDLSDLGDDLICIGGSVLYSSVLSFADELIITRLDYNSLRGALSLEITGDTSGVLLDENNISKNVTIFPKIPDFYTIINTQDLYSESLKIGTIFFYRNKFCFDNVFDINTKTPISLERRYEFLKQLKSI